MAVSIIQTIAVTKSDAPITTTVLWVSCVQVGQDTFCVSSWKDSPT